MVGTSEGEQARDTHTCIKYFNNDLMFIYFNLPYALVLVAVINAYPYFNYLDGFGNVKANKNGTLTILLVTSIFYVIKWAIILTCSNKIEFDSEKYNKDEDKFRYCFMISPDPLRFNNEKKPKVRKSIFSKVKRILPVSGNYFITNPTHGQLEKFKKESALGKLSVEDRVCKICYTNESNCIVENCGHAGMCEECVKVIIRERKDKFSCIMCRTLVKKILVVKYKNDGTTDVLRTIKPNSNS